MVFGKPPAKQSSVRRTDASQELNPNTVRPWRVYAAVALWKDLAHSRQFANEPVLQTREFSVEFVGTAIDVTEQAQARIELEKAFEEIKQRTETARRSERELRDVVNTVPATGGLNGSSSLENFTKRIDFRTNFLAAVTLSTSMKNVKVENNHRGAFRICA